MSDDVGGALREIVELLKLRNEQTTELSKRAEERLAKFQPRVGALPDYASMQEKHERDASERREVGDRRRQEDVEFRERLLAAIERQNELLARLLERRPS